MTDLKDGPLTGLRVLDMSRILAGPTVGQLLGDLGADVIKIERPGKGDDTRAWGPPFVKDKYGNNTRESAYYLCANRNTRSVAVDIAHPDGQALLADIAAGSDIILTNSFGGTRYRLKLHKAEDRVAEINTAAAAIASSVMIIVVLMSGKSSLSTMLPT